MLATDRRKPTLTPAERRHRRALQQLDRLYERIGPWEPMICCGLHMREGQSYHVWLCLACDWRDDGGLDVRLDFAWCEAEQC